MVVMTRSFARARRFALALSLVTLAAAIAPADAGAAESRKGALVRVQVIEDGKTTSQTKAVWWNDTVDVKVDVAGHVHALSIVPTQKDRGFALTVDHSRDGKMVADDEQVSSAGKKVVLDHGDTRIVVTVVPTTMHVDVE
jgi:hypothetical protein